MFKTEAQDVGHLAFFGDSQILAQVLDGGEQMLAGQIEALAGFSRQPAHLQHQGLALIGGFGFIAHFARGQDFVLGPFPAEGTFFKGDDLEFGAPQVVGQFEMFDDQLMGIGWKILIPVALANILVTGLVKVL